MPYQPPITLPDAVAELNRWLAALSSVSSGSSYSVGGRTLTRLDVTDIRAEIQRWHNTVLSLDALDNGKVRPLGATAAFPSPGRGGTGGAIVPGALWRSGLT